MAIGTYVWMGGVLVMSISGFVTYLRLRRKLVTASRLRDNIYLADEIDSPFVMGLIRPKIYLPSAMEEREQSYIILHEQHHIRRLDHIVKTLAFAALCVHWFNPLVWAAFILSGKDMEMSCDEAVVRKMGAQIRADYAASLLSLATGKRIIAGMPLAFGEGNTKSRIKNLANWRKPVFWVVFVAVIACVVLAVCLLTNPAADHEKAPAEDGYYLLIGADGVAELQVSSPGRSGGTIRAAGSSYRPGEKVWLEQLDGITDLRGVSITALGADGEIFYVLSIPEDATDAEIVNIVGGDSWLLAPTSFTQLMKDAGAAEETVSPVKWTYSPMMSATWHAAFHFNFDLANYSHIEASCDHGALWNLHAQGQPRDKTMRFEQGEPLCWTPGVGDSLTDTAENAKVTFTVYDGGEIVAKGVLDILRTGTENGQSFYEARLTDTQILALAQEPGGLEASVVIAGNGTVVSYSDVNHNLINERVIVREVAPDMLYELCVVEDGNIIWSTEAASAHVGWNTIMHYEEGGESYLVEYRPSMFQGVGSYTCTVFSLEGDKQTIKDEWSVDFELGMDGGVTETAEMVRFAERVDMLMRNSAVLLSTEQGVLVNRHTMATALPQIYPVRFDPDDILQAMEAAEDPTVPQKLTSNAAAFPEAPLEFVFASGAGSWGTYLTLQPDGYFIGDYGNTDMDIRYECKFEGQFTGIEQISDSCWVMKLGDLTMEEEEGTTWTEDGIHYIASDPHGISGGTTFLLYAPGTPADLLSAACRDWWPDAYRWRNGEIDLLNGWALYNLDAGYGFFTSWIS